MFFKCDEIDEDMVGEILFLKNVKVASYDLRSIYVTNTSYVDCKPEELGQVYADFSEFLKANDNSVCTHIVPPLRDMPGRSLVRDLLQFELIIKVTASDHSNSPYYACAIMKCPPNKLFEDTNNNTHCKHCKVAATRECPLLTVSLIF